MLYFRYIVKGRCKIKNKTNKVISVRYPINYLEWLGNACAVNAVVCIFQNRKNKSKDTDKEDSSKS